MSKKKATAMSEQEKGNLSDLLLAYIDYAEDAEEEGEVVPSGGETCCHLGCSQEHSAWDTQEGGSHYTGMAIQPFEYSMANNLDPLQHTVIKYVTRFRDKNGLEDLRKARHTLDLLIEWEEGARED